jgi:hypothetical protein
MRCKKCDIDINTISNNCPLCGSSLIGEKERSVYPHIKSKLTSNFVRKLVLFIVLIISITVLIINVVLTPKIKWGSFVVAALISSYLIFRSIMNGRKKVLKLLFTLNFLIICLAIFWDYYTGYRGWSLNFVLPSLCISYGIFLIVLRFVSYFAFRENSYSVYLNVLLEFVPIILLYYGKITFKPLAIISLIFGIANLLILIIFDGSRFKDDLEKKLHI